MTVLGVVETVYVQHADNINQPASTLMPKSLDLAIFMMINSQT